MAARTSCSTLAAITALAYLCGARGASRPARSTSPACATWSAIAAVASVARSHGRIGDFDIGIEQVDTEGSPSRCAASAATATRTSGTPASTAVTRAVVYELTELSTATPTPTTTSAMLTVRTTRSAGSQPDGCRRRRRHAAYSDCATRTRTSESAIRSRLSLAIRPGRSARSAYSAAGRLAT